MESRRGPRRRRHSSATSPTSALVEGAAPGVALAEGAALADVDALVEGAAPARGVPDAADAADVVEAAEPRGTAAVLEVDAASGGSCSGAFS
ncbi:hypothetical protein [Chondromyces apiculatus]|uniref:hypothetical protein n=1 Tax=Chondromyces apiculatus TaxID=51 RepID=UPI0005C5D048|nr:hypothetical protein [Chondromyces apiculatus]